MAVTREALVQYISEKAEIEETKAKIQRLEYRIEKIEERLAKIREGETVKDKVYGGDGGLQSYVIEGVPVKEWEEKEIELDFKKKMLKQQKQILEIMENQLVLRTCEVERFVCSIKDSVTRRIIHYRVFEGLQWSEVAKKIGGGNTEDGVKKIYYRFVDKKTESCPTCHA